MSKAKDDELPPYVSWSANGGLEIGVGNSVYVKADYCRQLLEPKFECRAGQLIVAKENHGWACEDQPMPVSHAVIGGATIIAAVLCALFAIHCSIMARPILRRKKQ